MSTDVHLSFAIQVENLTKRFQAGSQTIEVLKQLNLSIGDGEFVALMGASGSGKSTLLHLIAGLTPPDEGTIQIQVDSKSGEKFNPFDSKVSDYDRTLLRRRQLGIVFQAFNLIPTLSVENNILLPLLADGKTATAEVQERLNSLLVQLALNDRRTTLPDTLSGGEQQRVAIARALIMGASILLADEPTGNLDSISGQKLCEIIRTLCDQEHRTILLVTHESSVAIHADRTIVLRDGKILTEFDNRAFTDVTQLAMKYQQAMQSLSIGQEAD